jgi:hypothetical protein
MVRREATEEQKMQFRLRFEARMRELSLTEKDMIGPGPHRLSDRRLRSILDDTGPTLRSDSLGAIDHLFRLRPGSAERSLFNDVDFEPAEISPPTYTEGEVDQIRKLETVLRRMGIDDARFYKVPGQAGFMMSPEVAEELIQQATALLDEKLPRHPG